MNNPDAIRAGWDFGRSDSDTRTVGEIAEQTIRLWGDGRCEPDEAPSADEAGLLRLDIGKARHDLGCQLVYDSGRALAETIAWYRCYYTGGDAAALLSEQLAAYAETALSKNLAWGGRREKKVP